MSLPVISIGRGADCGWPRAFSPPPDIFFSQSVCSKMKLSHKHSRPGSIDRCGVPQLLFTRKGLDHDRHYQRCLHLSQFWFLIDPFPHKIPCLTRRYSLRNTSTRSIDPVGAPIQWLAERLVKIETPGGVCPPGVIRQRIHPTGMHITTCL